MANPIVLFDGVCNLCNASVQFLIRRDKQGKLRFASLQSSVGRALSERGGLSMDAMDSMVLVEDSHWYVRSTAALRILWHCGGFWRLLYGFVIVPRFLRDAVYNAIARNRYRWFGKRDDCLAPTPEVKARFLE